jgi:hypothetical protein
MFSATTRSALRSSSDPTTPQKSTMPSETTMSESLQLVHLCLRRTASKRLRIAVSRSSPKAICCTGSKSALSPSAHAGMVLAAFPFGRRIHQIPCAAGRRCHERRRGQRHRIGDLWRGRAHEGTKGDCRALRRTASALIWLNARGGDSPSIGRMKANEENL